MGLCNPPLIIVCMGICLCIVTFIHQNYLERPISQIRLNIPSGDTIVNDKLIDSKNNLSRRKPKVNLVIGILSRLMDLRRRIALRKTWLRTCYENKEQVTYKIFTDVISKDHVIENREYVEESKNNHDLVFMPFKGYTFASRLLWMFEYFTRHFEFDFFLRVDDDYFVCLDRLLKELPHRPKHGLYWGWLHCEQQDIMRLDEGFLILTHDIIEEVLSKMNTTLLCNAYGGQSVAMWITDSRINVTWFTDNSRIEHKADRYKKGRFEKMGDQLCDSFIAVHRSYPKYMYSYWRSVYKRRISYHIPEMTEYHAVCSYRKIFDYRKFSGKWYSVPKLCKYFPTSNGKSYLGRSEK